MFGASITTRIFTRIRDAANRFACDNQGNIAVIFAIALVPIISFVGAAIDYSRASSARTSMQAALDSTALMLSKDLSSGLITTAQISAKAQAYFAALYTNTEATGVSVTATYTASSSMGSTIQVNGTGTIATDFMKVVGFRISTSVPVRPPHGAMCGCAWRWRSTTRDRWPTTEK
jgi:Flp pilus assembly protein TadG